MGEKDNGITIAIVTTVFNDGAVLPRLLSSLLAQTAANFVHYIFDDGSTEPCDSLIEKYVADVQRRAKPYKVIFYKSGENLGVNKAHEWVFRRMDCTHFTWIDADDWVGNTFIAYITKIITKHHDSFSVYHLNSYTYSASYVRSKHTTAFSYNKKELKQKDQFPNFCMMSDEWFAHHFVIKRADFIKVNPNLVIYDNRRDPNSRWYDGQIFFQMSACHLPFCFISKPLSHILNRPTSVSRSASSRSEKHISFMSPLNETMFRELEIPEESHRLYQILLPYRALSLEILENLASGNRLTAKSQLCHYKRFLKNHGLSKSYLLFHTAIKHALLKSYLGPVGYLLTKIRKILIGGH